MNDNFLYNIGDRVICRGFICEIIAVCADEQFGIFFELLRLDDDSSFYADARMFHPVVSTSYPVGGLFYEKI